jgi:cytochrome c-type biogenesis protein
MVSLLIFSFVAGALTVAAPCILPLLPVVVGGTALGGGERRWFRPLVITLSLAGSVVLFSLLLKATTVFLGVPQAVWNIISGGIVLLFGINLLWPTLWEKLVLATGFYSRSNQLLGKSSRQKGLAGDILLGAALGPVFSSCSPTYALIIAAILPRSFGEGFALLVAYALGLAAILLLIAVAGQAAVAKMGWAANPKGWFRRSMGILFIIVGVAVIIGFDKAVQSYVLEQGWYDPIKSLEETLRR